MNPDALHASSFDFREALRASRACATTPLMYERPLGSKPAGTIAVSEPLHDNAMNIVDGGDVWAHAFELILLDALGREGATNAHAAVAGA